MARPIKPEKDKRDIDVSVAYSSKEIKKLRQRAGKTKLAVYVRTRSLEDKTVRVVPKINENIAGKLRDALAKIDRIAVVASDKNFSNNHTQFWNLMRELQGDLRDTHHEILTYADDNN